MNKLTRIELNDSMLVLIDFQEKLMPSIYEADKLEDSVCRLIKGCRYLGMPIITTQQYTKGLGETVEHITNALNESLDEVKNVEMSLVEKITFSCVQNEDFSSLLENSGKKTILLTGIEAHICVAQTALDLVDKGYNVVLITDCISSRKLEDKNIAIKRLLHSGVTITTYESLLFELTGSAKHPQFKNISKIVK